MILLFYLIFHKEITLQSLRNYLTELYCCFCCENYPNKLPIVIAKEKGICFHQFYPHNKLPTKKNNLRRRIGLLIYHSCLLVTIEPYCYLFFRWQILDVISMKLLSLSYHLCNNNNNNCLLAGGPQITNK